MPPTYGSEWGLAACRSGVFVVPVSCVRIPDPVHRAIQAFLASALVLIHRFLGSVLRPRDRSKPRLLDATQHLRPLDLVIVRRARSPSTCKEQDFSGDR